MSAHMPIGGPQKEAAAWELIVASIILFVMILTRMALSSNKFSSKVPAFLSAMMREGSKAHFALYVLLFALVFSSAMSFFIN
jgi:cytochrome b561